MAKVWNNFRGYDEFAYLEKQTLHFIGNISIVLSSLLDTNSYLKVTIYKADLKTNIYYLIGFVILIGVTVLLSSKFLFRSWPFLIVWLLLFVLFNVISSRLFEIQLDKINGNLVLIHKNYFGIKKILKYDLREIEFTYKRQATSFRGGIKNVCIIYFSGEKVIQIVPGSDG